LAGAFVRLGRPHFLAGGFIGFALGAAAARFDGATLAVATYLWGQALVSAFHVMVHYANEFYDRAGDVLETRTPFSGGSGVLVAGELPARVAIVAAVGFGAAGTALVIRAALAGDRALALAGAAIGILAWIYSAPPFRLLARGLGELDTMVVVGLLVPLAGYAACAHALTPHAIAAALPGTAAMFAMMLCVEIPDAGADAASGKRNLVVRWGVGRALGAARAACALAVAGLCFALTAVFGLTAAVAVALASVAALIGATLTAARAPAWGVAFYTAIVLGGLVGIVTA
jgi:1,4-dihydroxy-2-naphthoate octaprenyltransferase